MRWNNGKKKREKSVAKAAKSAETLVRFDSNEAHTNAETNDGL